MTREARTIYPWSCHVSDLERSFESSKSLGLNPEQVIRALEIYGKNSLKTEKEIGHFTIFLRQFRNPMVYLLFSATLAALVLGEKLDAIAILTILILNSVIGYFQEAKASVAIAALKKLSVPSARVIREGSVRVIPSENVVPGDVLQLEAGDYVTADARVIEAFQLTADETLLTGESLPVKKTDNIIDRDAILGDRKNMLHAGCAISSGSGKAIVIATGMRTEIGQIAELLEETDLKKTPLQIRLNILSNKLIMLGGVVIILVVILRYLEGGSWFGILMSAISLAVAAIPEGLPTVVTLALTLSIRRMTKRHVIVRNLSAVETLGSTDVICTDKTGTLTTGAMSVREMFLLDIAKTKHFYEAMVLCNNASIDNGGSGDPTERALLDFVNKENFPLKALQSRYPRVHEWSFESNRKRMSVAIYDEEGVKIITKGAPEGLVELCHLSEVEKKIIKEKIIELTSKGQRLLAFAEKKGEVIPEVEKVEVELEFLGLIAMADPPKAETIEAIKKCKSAGIKIVMITGDHPVTAKAIAMELGIAVKGSFDQVLTGRDVEGMSEEELKLKVHTTAVYARVSPLHKLRIVNAFQARGMVVAMTGDGVNDAPALKKAQIGVAMGKSGTEVARQASSMIITDDNFSTIVSAVEEGRAIYGNIKRTIQYLLSTNLAEILIVFGASILSLPVPFTPIGLLWINLVTDGLPSLALAAEPLDKHFLKDSRKPSPTTFFEGRFLIELFFVGILMTVLSLGLYYYMLETSTKERACTYTFTFLVYMSLGRSFSCRSETRSFFQLKINYYHLASVMLPILLQFSIDHTELYQKLFKVGELSFNENVLLLFLSFFPVFILELLKYRSPLGTDEEKIPNQ